MPRHNQSSSTVYPHPLHAILLGGALTLFIATLLSDLAYSASYEIQWKNFSSWLLVGALVLGGLALLWGTVDVFRVSHRGVRLFYPLALLAAWIVGFINALIHAKDAWASMPEAVILSVIAAVLIVLATGFGCAPHDRRARAAELT